MILRDDIATHQKFLKAGRLLGGPFGVARAFAVYVAAIGYARKHATNGIVGDAFCASQLVDSDVQTCVTTLSSRTVRLFHKVKNGYRIHDFAQYNIGADKLRHKRKLTRERMRRLRAARAVENSPGKISTGQSAASQPPDVTRHSEKEKEIRTYVDRSTDSSVPEVPLVQRPNGRAAFQTLAKTPAGDQNFAVLVRLIHAVMDAEACEDACSPDLIEAAKVAAAQRGILYLPDVFSRALRSAGSQRARRRES